MTLMANSDKVYPLTQFFELPDNPASKGDTRLHRVRRPV